MLKYVLLSLLLFSYVTCDDDVTPDTDDVINDTDDVINDTDDVTTETNDATEDDDPEDYIVTDEEMEEDEDDFPGKIHAEPLPPNKRPGQESISYSQPTLTEEEQKSHHFADRYRCDACQILVHNVGTDFKTAESKIPKKRKKKLLGDVDLIGIVDTLCTKDKFEGYSVQQFDEQVIIKGPAFPERSGPGMSMGGGLWPVRYVNYCGMIFEEVDEDELYAYYRAGNLFAELCMEDEGHCHGVLSSVPETLDIKPDNFKVPKEEL